MGTYVKALALARIAFGGAMLVMPEQSVRGWIGRRAASYGGTQTITQACGVRDLALGAGTLAALTSGKEAQDWVLTAAVADLADLIATVTGEGVPLKGRLIVSGMAGTAIAISVGYAAERAKAPAQGSEQK
jgi:hypothetical protein